MEKKLWSNAEVVELGVESTKEGETLENSTVTELDEKGLWVTKCLNCGGKGPNAYSIRHRESCKFSGLGCTGTDQTLPPTTLS